MPIMRSANRSRNSSRMTKLIVTEFFENVETGEDLDEYTKYQKKFFNGIGGYYKAVTVLPQMTASFLHFCDTGGFKNLYVIAFDMNTCVLGVLGEGAALMFEIYRAFAYQARPSQICNYSLTTFISYYYGVHKQFPIYLWKQNWIFLQIPILCLMRINLLQLN
eukprot:UN26776